MGFEPVETELPECFLNGAESVITNSCVAHVTLFFVSGPLYARVYSYITPWCDNFFSQTSFSREAVIIRQISTKSFR